MKYNLPALAGSSNLRLPSIQSQLEPKKKKRVNSTGLKTSVDVSKAAHVKKICDYFPNYAKGVHKSYKSMTFKNFGFTEVEFQEMQSQLKSGDETLFEQIFLKHFDSCISYLIKNHKIGREEAYDITMETLIDFRKRLIQGKIKYGNLRFLFTKMATQRHIKEIKVDKKKENLSSLYDDENLEPDLLLLEKAMMKMGQACKDLLKLHYYEKMPLKDIAQLKDTAPATIRKQKQRCIANLKSLFRQYSH